MTDVTGTIPTDTAEIACAIALLFLIGASGLVIMSFVFERIGG
ncbi:hypothetical protein [Rhizobium sp. P40RR-XXII]|nr:hypothetical protein [Rhizobium sp. P40RR-XXII]